jgi:hypothetical protein
MGSPPTAALEHQISEIRTHDDERGVGVGRNRMIDYEIDNETKPRGEST